MDALWSNGALELARMIARRETTSRSVIEAHLDRIGQLNPQLNAVVELMADGALAAADAADRAVTRGAQLGPLHGVPCTVKINVDVAGSARSSGVLALADAIPPSDSPDVARLREAGAIVLGRTNMPDFGPRWHTDNALHGATVNPRGRDLSPGGSSGGEAAAIATGMSPLGVGNDSGGSLRVPAQLCGIASLRPSLGRVPSATAIDPQDMAMTMQLVNVSGPLARRVEDLEAALRIMSGPHPQDPSAVPAPLARWRGGAELPPVAVSYAPAGVAPDPSVEAGVRSAVDALTDAGYRVEEVEPPELAATAKMWRDLQLTELSRTLLPVMRQIASPDAIRFVELSLEAFPPVSFDDYVAAFAERSRLARSWAEFGEKYPLILGPVMTRTHLKVGEDVRDVEAVARIYDAIALVVAANGIGLPAAVVPVGITDGLPHAVQVLGRRFDELDCLAAAAAIEARTPPVAPIDPVA